MLATALAVTVLVAAMTIAASTQHLLDTRALYGWSRDAQIGSDGTPSVGAPIVAGLEQSPLVRAFAAGTVTDLEIAGTRVSAFALDDLRGEVAIDLVDGRRPRTADEIVLGFKTLQAVGADIGDRVPVHIGRSRMPMTVVGSAVFSRIGNNGQLGRGAQITFAALQSALEDAPKNVVQIDLERGADETAVRTQLQDAVSVLPLISPAPPAELVSFGRVDNLPTVLAVIMIVVAAAILAHTMVTSVQRRRRDYALLESLGFVRRQVSASVATQATSFAIVSVLIGIPIGLLIGRIVWAEIADQLAVPSEPTTNTIGVVLIVPGVILLANVVAAIPAWVARGTRPAVELRAE